MGYDKMIVKNNNNKKGQMSVQFNWIFVLIAGGIILAFFVGMVMKQKTVSEVGLSATIVTDLDSIFTSARLSSGTATVIELPKIEMEFACDGYSVGGVKRGLESNIVFAPKSISGKYMITLSEEFNVPYKVDNFLYVTSSDIRYVFVYGEDGYETIAREIYEGLPDELNKDIMSENEFDDLKDTNDFKTRIVFVGVDKTYPSDFRRSDVSAVQFDELGGGTAKNYHVKFYEKSGTEFVIIEDSETTKETFFHMANIRIKNYETVYAAIFSEDPELYKCMMRRAFNKMSIMGELYKNRADDIVTIRADCKIKYTNNNKLGELIRESKECSNTFPSSTDVECTANYIMDIFGDGFGLGPADTGSLESLNEQLRRKSCPLIY